MWNTGDLQHWADKLGIGHRPGSTSRVRPKVWCPTRTGATSSTRKGNRTSLVGRRQHPAGDRPGRPADQPAAAGDRLCRARQRRHDRHPAPRHGNRGRGRAGAEGIRPGAAAQHQDRPRHALAILEGLHQAAQGPQGTSYGIFDSFPIAVAGKTGTAERPGTPTNPGTRSSLPYPNPRIVTVVTIEEGGFGAESAAPAAKQILEAVFRHKLGAAAESEGEGENQSPTG